MEKLMAADSVIELMVKIRQREHKQATAGGDDSVKVGDAWEERVKLISEKKQKHISNVLL